MYSIFLIFILHRMVTYKTQTNFIKRHKWCSLLYIIYNIDFKQKCLDNIHTKIVVLSTCAVTKQQTLTLKKISVTAHLARFGHPRPSESHQERVFLVIWQRHEMSSHRSIRVFWSGENFWSLIVAVDGGGGAALCRDGRAVQRRDGSSRAHLWWRNKLRCEVRSTGSRTVCGKVMFCWYLALSTATITSFL